MKNILTLTKPLFSVTEALLRSINKICAEQSIAYFIAGATAREILILDRTDNYVCRWF